MTGKYFLHQLIYLQDKMQRRVKIITISDREYMQTVAQNTNNDNLVSFMNANV